MTGPVGCASVSSPPPEGLVGRLRRVGLNSGVYLAGDVLVQGLALLLFPLYTRALSPAEYGVLAVTTTTIVVLTLVLGLSLQAAVTRLHFEARDEEDRRRLYGTVLMFLIAVPGLIAIGLELAGEAGLLGVFDDVPYVPYLRYAVAIAYVSIFLELPVQIYIARQRPVPVLMLTAANGLLIASMTVLLVVILDRGVIGALQAQLIGAGTMALVAIAVTIRMSRLRFSRAWIAAALAFGLPLVPHALGQWALHLSDRVILERMVSGTQLGLYSLGASIGFAASFLAHASGRAFGPVIIKALKEPEERSSVPVLATYWLAGLCFACVAFALFSTDVIRLLTTERYHGATRVVPFTVFGFLAFGVYTIVAQGTFFAMRTRLLPLWTLIAGAANVGLNLLLIPRFGITGSAAATLAAFSLLALLQGVQSQRVYPIAWEYRRGALLIVATGLTFAAGSLGGGGTTLTSLAVKALALAIVFPGVLLLVGFVRHGELAWLRERLRQVRSARPG